MLLSLVLLLFWVASQQQNEACSPVSCGKTLRVINWALLSGN